LQSFTTEEKS